MLIRAKQKSWNDGLRNPMPAQLRDRKGNRARNAVYRHYDAGDNLSFRSSLNVESEATATVQHFDLADVAHKNVWYRTWLDHCLGTRTHWTPPHLRKTSASRGESYARFSQPRYSRFRVFGGNDRSLSRLVPLSHVNAVQANACDECQHNEGTGSKREQIHDLPRSQLERDFNTLNTRPGGKGFVCCDAKASAPVNSVSSRASCLPHLPTVRKLPGSLASADELGFFSNSKFVRRRGSQNASVSGPGISPDVVIGCVSVSPIVRPRLPETKAEALATGPHEANSITLEILRGIFVPPMDGQEINSANRHGHNQSGCQRTNKAFDQFDHSGLKSERQNAGTFICRSHHRVGN